MLWKAYSIYGKKMRNLRSIILFLKKNLEIRILKRIITGCQNCFMTIGNNSKDIEVISLWEVLANVGIPEEKIGIGKSINVEFTIHDPCPTRDIDIIHSSIRQIVDELGFKIDEMEYNKGKNTLLWFRWYGVSYSKSCIWRLIPQEEPKKQNRIYYHLLSGMCRVYEKRW